MTGAITLAWAGALALVYLLLLVGIGLVLFAHGEREVGSEEEIARGDAP